MAITVKELARICQAQLLGGGTETLIHSAANLDSAQAGQLTFLGAAKYAAKLKNCSSCTCYAYDTLSFT